MVLHHFIFFFTRVLSLSFLFIFLYRITEAWSETRGDSQERIDKKEIDWVGQTNHQNHSESKKIRYRAVPKLCELRLRTTRLELMLRRQKSIKQNTERLGLASFNRADASSYQQMWAEGFCSCEKKDRYRTKIEKRMNRRKTMWSSINRTSSSRGSHNECCVL
jgi:hypothetical protein